MVLEREWQVNVCNPYKLLRRLIKIARYFRIYITAVKMQKCSRARGNYQSETRVKRSLINFGATWNKFSQFVGCPLDGLISCVNVFKYTQQMQLWRSNSQGANKMMVRADVPEHTGWRRVSSYLTLGDSREERHAFGSNVRRAEPLVQN